MSRIPLPPMLYRKDWVASSAMRTMMQYLFQSINFRGDAVSKPHKDLLQGVGTEEISHVELIGTTISRLLDGSAPRAPCRSTLPPTRGADPMCTTAATWRWTCSTT